VNPRVGGPVSGMTAFDSGPVPKAAVTIESSPPAPLKTAGSETNPGPTLKSRIEYGRGAVQPWPGAVEVRKNQVRRKLECHGDSMSCHDFDKPPVGAGNQQSRNTKQDTERAET
jgi:hypothetical protein